MAKNQKPDAPGQVMLEAILNGSLREEVVIRVPKGQSFEFNSPPKEPPVEPVVLTKERLACGLIRAMEMPGEEFHEAVRMAVRKGLDIVAFNKRMHGAFYHEYHSARKRARGK